MYHNITVLIDCYCLTLLSEEFDKITSPRRGFVGWRTSVHTLPENQYTCSLHKQRRKINLPDALQVSCFQINTEYF